MQAGDQQTILSPGDVLGSYRIDSFLGQGGFGVTYVARDTMLDIQVAIKEYLPERIARRAADKTIQPRSEEHAEVVRKGLISFLKEARTLAKFKHPNIVRVMSIFELNNTAYMVMEYERGHELKLLLDQRKNISEVALKALFGPILDGLEEVHRFGFIHRDIKPANILVREDGTPVLLDFGSARLASGHQTELLTAMVTAGFAPLEQYSGLDEQQGPWTDIYALGAVLYYAVRSVAPVDSTLRGAAVLNDNADPFQGLSSLKPEGYSVAFCRAVDWALQFKVSSRPQSLQQWRSRLFQEELDETVPVPGRHRDISDQPTRQVTTQNSAEGSSIRRASAEAGAIQEESTQTYATKQDTYEHQTIDLADADSNWDMSNVSSHRKKRRKKVSSSRNAWRAEWLFARKTLLMVLSLVGVSVIALVAINQPTNAPAVTTADTAGASVSRVASLTDTDSTGDPETSNRNETAAQSPTAVDGVRPTNTAANARSPSVDEASEVELSRLLALQQSTELQNSERLASDRRIQREEAKRQAQIQREREEREAADVAREAASVQREAARQERLARAAVEADAERLAGQERNQFVQLPDTNVKPVIAGSDMSDVLTRFNGLSNALRERDGEAIRRFTVESSRKNAYFDYVFRTFDTVETRVTNISASRQDQTIRATLRVNRLIRANGDIAIPPEEFRSIPIYSIKETQWSAIHW